jgi:hypothetical protein
VRGGVALKCAFAQIVSKVRGDLWRSGLARPSPLLVMSVPPVVQWFKPQSRQEIFRLVWGVQWTGRQGFSPSTSASSPLSNGNGTAH